jgi:hypothetical protein
LRNKESEVTKDFGDLRQEIDVCLWEGGESVVERCSEIYANAELTNFE